MTYKVTIKSFPDSDIQPFIVSLEHADVQEVAAIGARSRADNAAA